MTYSQNGVEKKLQQCCLAIGVLSDFVRALFCTRAQHVMRSLSAASEQETSGCLSHQDDTCVHSCTIEGQTISHTGSRGPWNEQESLGTLDHDLETRSP